ncbi:sigma-54-dependent Fis family transcriptional regulator [Siminovitchia sediminis]|uniref:Sigma-54-dependent Fis family transcriptional regulator n=1 Tax=Siminovitchia sediminis TaxID=1274353 RepID=A0ABW4KM12_9BACI
MIEVQDTLKKAVWSRFVQEGVLDENRINYRIAESWYMCRQNGVNPYHGKGESILLQNQLLQRKNENRTFMHAALPVIKHLQKFFAHTKSLFLLVDSEGYVLYREGHPVALEKADIIQFIEGVQWTEKQVGTNAVGTALRIKEPISVTGPEHYAVASHPWECASAPIADGDGKVAGILNVSYPLEYGTYEHMLPVVVSAAYAIEQKLIRSEREKELELIRQFSPITPQDTLTLLCTQKEKVIWLTSQLHKQLSHSTPLTLQEILAEGYKATAKQPAYSKNQEEVIGYKVCLEKTDENQISKGRSIHSSFQLDGVMGISRSFQSSIKKAEKAAETNITVHLTGETGTGKDVMARSIHVNSSRKNGPFIAVNCGIIPKELIASELFGYTRGAFTGADRKGHKGKFQQANGGTLFLDEVAEISHEMQVALLRVLEEKKVVPVGGSKPEPVDVRIITATHCDLTELVRKGKIRKDLFYRICIYPIHLPPLRERMEDLPFFIQEYCEKSKWPMSFSTEMIKCLETYDWPGNIRELYNFLDRLRVELGSNPPTTEVLQSLLYSMGPSNEKTGALHSEEPLTLRERMEKDKIVKALIAADGNITKAAAKLNISRSTFYRKIKKYEL